MPIFRELWGWGAFSLLAVVSLIAAICTSDWSFTWGYLIVVGQKVEPLWIGSAILVYTSTEGFTMLADSFKRKQFAAGEAKGEAKGQAKTLSAIEEMLKRDRTPEDVQRIIDETREIMRQGGHKA